jgi:hypothetical protein
MKFIWLMTAGLLFLAVLSVGSGFYTVLRFWVFFAALYVAYVNYEKILLQYSFINPVNNVMLSISK